MEAECNEITADELCCALTSILPQPRLLNLVITSHISCCNDCNADALSRLHRMNDDLFAALRRYFNNVAAGS